MSSGLGMLFNPPNDSLAPRHNEGNPVVGVVIRSQPVKRCAANDDGSSAMVSNRFLSPGNRGQNEARRSRNQATDFWVCCLLLFYVCARVCVYIIAQLRERLHANQPASPNRESQPTDSRLFISCIPLPATSCQFLPLPATSCFS